MESPESVFLPPEEARGLYNLAEGEELVAEFNMASDNPPKARVIAVAATEKIKKIVEEGANIRFAQAKERSGEPILDRIVVIKTPRLGPVEETG